MVGRGKAYGCGQKAALEAAFAKRMTPRKILSAYPDHGFKLNGLEPMAKKHSKAHTLDRQAGSGRKKERTKKQNKKAKKGAGKNPNASQRKLAQAAGVCRAKVRRIMKDELELKTHKTIKAQKLKVAGKQKRLEACVSWQSQMAAGALNPKNIFFADEKMFTVGADATKGAQNFRVHVHKSIRKEDAPAEFLARGQGRQQGGARCMVSAGVSYRGKGALRIAEAGAEINAETYLELAKNTYETDMIRLFRPDAPDGHAKYHFQQDNAPSRAARIAKEYLAANVPSVLAPWPANSPDFNVLDYAVWGALETSVSGKMRGKQPTLQNLKVAIQEAYDELDLGMVGKSIKQWKKRAAECIAQEGGHFEQRLGAK